MIRLALIATLLLSGCVTAPPSNDTPENHNALRTMKSQGVGVWADGCWEYTQAPGVKPYLRDESLALATSWGVVLNNHLADHGIQSNATKVPVLCTSESKRRMLQSTKQQTLLGRGTPFEIDKTVKTNPALRSALDTVQCQTAAKISERYPMLKSTCDKTLSPIAQQELSKYFGYSRYLLLVNSQGQSQSFLTGAIASALFVPAVAITSGVTGLTVAGPATLGGDSNAAKTAVRLVDAGGTSGGTSNARRIFSHGILYDIQTQQTLWYSDYAATQGVSCSRKPPASKEATRIFGPMLCK